MQIQKHNFKRGSCPVLHFHRKRINSGPNPKKKSGISGARVTDTGDAYLGRVLLDTGDAYLLEFDKSARRLDQATPPRRVRWGGMVVDNMVFGDNQMGALLMEIRGDLAKRV